MSKTKGLLAQYYWGLISCVVLTGLAFCIVGQKWLSGSSAVVAILVLALLQFFVQLKCFLHLSLKPDKRWHVATLIFTIIVVVVLVLGSLWIMVSLNNKMMLGAW